MNPHEQFCPNLGCSTRSPQVHRRSPAFGLMDLEDVILYRIGGRCDNSERKIIMNKGQLGILLIGLLLATFIPFLGPKAASASPVFQTTQSCNDLSDFPVGAVASEFRSGASTVIRNACLAHRQCRSSSTSNVTCDARLRQAVQGQCRSLSGPCMVAAQAYVDAVKTLHSNNLSNTSGQILSCVGVGFAGDEFALIMFVTNPGNTDAYYRGVGRGANDHAFDIDPTTPGNFRVVNSGRSTIFTLDTNWDPRFDRHDIGSTATCQLYMGEAQNPLYGRIIAQQTILVPNPDADILSVSHRKIDDWWGDDEMEACVTFRNSGTQGGEFDVRLYSSSNSKLDEEPDTYWEDVGAGDRETICVGTDGIWPSISDVGSRYTVRVTEEHLGAVACWTCNTPTSTTRYLAQCTNLGLAACP
jgi:hypothetical protein